MDKTGKRKVGAGVGVGVLLSLELGEDISNGTIRGAGEIDDMVGENTRIARGRKGVVICKLI